MVYHCFISLSECILESHCLIILYGPNTGKDSFMLNETSGRMEYGSEKKQDEAVLYFPNYLTHVLICMQKKISCRK